MAGIRTFPDFADGFVPCLLVGPPKGFAALEEVGMYMCAFGGAWPCGGGPNPGGGGGGADKETGLPPTEIVPEVVTAGGV